MVAQVLAAARVTDVILMAEMDLDLVGTATISFDAPLSGQVVLWTVVAPGDGAHLIWRTLCGNRFATRCQQEAEVAV